MQCASSKSNSQLLLGPHTYVCRISQGMLVMLWLCMHRQHLKLTGTFDCLACQIELSVVDPTYACAQASRLCSRLFESGHAISR